MNTEALKALYGSLHKQDYNLETDQHADEKRINLPSFKELVHCVYNESVLRMQKSSKCYSQGNHTLPFLPNVYKEVFNNF